MNHHFLRRTGVVALAAVLVVINVGATPVIRASGSVGVQGTDTSLPLTDSALTISGRGRFSKLKVTVNQTNHLANQAVSISWTGGDPTQQASNGRFGSNFLQIFQCWGDDDGTNPDNPGPPPQQCEQGAVAGSYGFSSTAYPARFTLERIISQSFWGNFDPNNGKVDPNSGNLWMPFRAVDGTTVGVQEDTTWRPRKTGSYWLNPYYNQTTTNEIAGAATRPDGTGQELFQAYTGLESSGLGCGQTVQPVSAGTYKIPKCWLVVVPRGAAVDENTGSPFGGSDAEFQGVSTSPMMASAWANRIAFPLDFNPLDSPCKLGQDERRLSGTEMAYPAVANWQPQLCTAGSLPPYSYAPIGDATARQQLTNPQPGAPGMVVMSRPIDTENLDPANPVVYSPLTVSGITIGFNIERIVSPQTDDAERALATIRVAHIYLTPRLVAKLLTESYQGAVRIISPPNYPWMMGNPLDLSKDPDFLQFNPEFTNLQVFDTRLFSGLSVSAGTSDAARQVWEWIVADPEAKAWMDGQPDPWGMKVNPAYSTSASVNSGGTAFDDPLPTSFPKSDQYCYQAPQAGTDVKVTPPALCSTDWMPYQRNFASTAQVGRSTVDGAKVIPNPYPLSTVDAWSKVPPQSLGYRSVLVLTDTPNAALFGLQTASLSRAGDDSGERLFVAPDSPGLYAEITAMKSATEPTVLEPAPTVDAPGAYPLTTITYAATMPLGLDDAARADYAAFLQYAVGDGQVPGLAFGKLPRGYLPLPQVLRSQAATAIDKVLHPAALISTTTTTTSTTTTTTTSTTTTVPATTTSMSSTTSSTSASTTPLTSTSVASSAVATPTGTYPTTGYSPSGSSSGGSTSNVGSSFPSASSVSTNGDVASPTVQTDPAPSIDTTVSIDTASTETTADALAPTSTQSAAGSSAPSQTTPVTPGGKARLAVPAIGGLALVSALGALEITKRPRRSIRRRKPAGS